MDDEEKVEEGNFNFYEIVWSHCKKNNYRSSESYENTYGILKGMKKSGDLHMVFIHIEKVCDRLLWEVHWNCWRKNYLPFHYARVIKDMYETAETKD